MYNVESETKQKINGKKDGQTERHTAFVYNITIKSSF